MGDASETAPLPAGRTPPVLRSKLSAPSPITDSVVQERLITSISESSAAISLLVAPAGYGKTTALVEAVAAIGAPTLWLNLDDGDNDVVRLWTHFAAGFEEVGGDVTGLRDALVSGSGSPVDEFLAALERHDGPLTVVLDDAHVLVGAPVNEHCNRLMTHAPPSVRILVSTRSELAWSVSRLATQGRLDRYDDRSLALLGDMGRAVLQPEIDAGVLTSTDAETIVERVEGWPAGLRLAKLAMAAEQGKGTDVAVAIAGDQPDLARYLTAEVLAARSDEEREFLLATSVLEVLTPAACDAVTGCSGSLGVLRRLVSDHVFTTEIDDDGPAFVYHRLFAEFLQTQLAEQGDEAVTAMHERALEHFVEGSDTGAVVMHAVAAGRGDVAMDRLGEEYIDIANDGRIEELWRWVALIGPEEVLAHPILSSTPAWASLNLGRYDEIEPWLESFWLLDDVDAGHAVDFAIHAGAVRSHRDRHLGRLDDAVRHGTAELDRIPDASTPIVSATALAAAGVALALSGRRAEATDCLERAVARGTAVDEPSGEVQARSYLALLTDDAKEVERHLASVFEIVDSPEHERFHLPSVAWLVRARTSIDEGRIADAEVELDRATTLARIGCEPLVDVLIDLQQARRLHLTGDDEGRRAALRHAEVVLADSTGTEWLAGQVKEAHAATRFAPLDHTHLPVGARDLSERELEVLRLLPYDLSRKQLARQLYVSENTVKTHLTSIRHKLGVSDRSALVERGRELGLLDG